MKGLFDTAKKMAVFVRVLLLTFALQCVCGAVGYAQENPTGGDQGAPSCSAGECTSGDSCQCLTQQFLNNDGDEFCADSNPTKDDSNEYQLEEVTNDQQREELLKRLTEAQSKGEQGVNDGAVHYIFVDQYLKTPKEVYEEKLEQATPGERWLIERMTENYKSLRGGKNEFPPSVNTGIALEQMLPQVIPRYHVEKKFEITETIRRLSKLDYSDETYGAHDVSQRDEVYRNWWALELGNEHTCYYNGYWTRHATGAWDTFRALKPKQETRVPKHQQLLRLFKCINNEYLRNESPESKLKTILSIKDKSHEDALFALEFGASLLPGVGTFLLVNDNWDELRAGDCTAWGYFLGSAAGEVFLIGKGTAFVRALRVANKAKEVGKGWRIASIVTGTAGVGLVGRPLLAKAREGDFGPTEWGELAHVGIELVFLVLDIKAEIPKNTRIFKQKVPSSAVGCAEAKPLKCDALDANRPTWIGIADHELDLINPPFPHPRRGVGKENPLLDVEKAEEILKKEDGWESMKDKTKRKKITEKAIENLLEDNETLRKTLKTEIKNWELQARILLRKLANTQKETWQPFQIRNKVALTIDTNVCNLEYLDLLGHSPTMLSQVSALNKETGEIVGRGWAINGQVTDFNKKTDIDELWEYIQPPESRPFYNCAETQAIDELFESMKMKLDDDIKLDNEWHKKHEILVFTIRLPKEEITVREALSEIGRGSELNKIFALISNNRTKEEVAEILETTINRVPKHKVEGDFEVERAHRCNNCKEWCETGNGMTILSEGPWYKVLMEKK